MNNRRRAKLHFYGQMAKKIPPEKWCVMCNGVGGYVHSGVCWEKFFFILMG